MSVFLETDEQGEIRRAARTFVREQMPVTHLRGLRDGTISQGRTRQLWAEAAELGWAGALVADAQGGIELGMVDVGILLEECGRTLAPTHLLGTAVMGASALTLATTLAKDAGALAALELLAEGRAIYALAFEEQSRFAPYAVETTAARDADGWVVTGHKTNVLDGPDADVLLVSARVSGAANQRDGLALFRVDAKLPGVQVRALDRVDSRSAARVQFDGVRVSDAHLLGSAGTGADILDVVLDRATAALAAEMLGSIQEMFDRTLAYLKERTQFGAPIGSFQALKHRAARMFCEVELTRSVVRAALHALDEGTADASALVSAAKARATDTYVLVSNEAVQMHGGIGATDELDIGFYLKRARVAAMALGTAPYHRHRFGRLSGY